MSDITMKPNLPYGSRLPKQIRRALPVYIAVILFITILSNANSIGSSMKSASPRNLKRSFSSQKILKTGSQFPKKIWQTWKIDPLNFEVRDSDTAKTWTTKNPGYRYEVLTDNNDLHYVETHFGPEGLNRPDIVETYRSLTAKIIKADLLRYLVMYMEGGVYADIDVEALKPVKRFIPDRYDEGDIDMVISVEIDQPDFKDHPILGRKSQSFCQWTFMCKPRLPVMLKLVDNIIAWLNDLSQKQGKPISELQIDFDEVISGTGPSAFTVAVLEAMSKPEKRPMDWSAFHDLNESKLIGRVLVLTVEAFAAGQGHSDSGNHNSRTALVKHHYHASAWPTNHPRFSHPVYGEVEKCNWDPDCVKLWDYNVAVFNNLSEEDKQKEINSNEAAQRQLADLAALVPPPPAAPLQRD